MKSSLSLDPEPRSVIVGDINNDYQMDIIVANSGTDTIGIFISTGNGTFSKQQTYPTGPQSQPLSIAISDFDNDNYSDIAVANYGTNSIGIFFGSGDGTFYDQVLFSLGSSRPIFITVSDFNHDHQTDIAVVNYGTNNISILFGYGNGTFQNQITYFAGYDSIPYSLAIGDFNNDNNLDIAVTNYGTNNIGIFLGYGDGMFVSQQIYTTLSKSNPSSIAVGDFNTDNYMDIVVANNGTGNVGIFFGYGNGSFRAQKTFIIMSNFYPQYVTVGDFNQDNKLDIVIVDSQNNKINILPGYGNGTFSTITTYNSASGSNPVWVAVTDFNNDNQSDIVVVDYGTDDISTLIGYSINPDVRNQTAGLGSPTITGAVATADFNGDHFLDIVFNDNSSVVIKFGLGDGSFNNQIILSTGNVSNIQYISVGDLNNDNRMDIVVGDVGYNTVSIFLGYGDGTFATIKSYSAGTGSQPSWIALSDVNNDNRTDIVSANPGTNTIGILVGYGNGTFATMILYSTGAGSVPYSVAVGDINHDNYSDIVVAGWYGYVIIFLGRNNAGFVASKVYAVGANYGTFSIVLFDFNSDKNLDIAVANVYADNICVLLGYGNGTFAKQSSYSTGIGSQPFYIIVADFNNDTIYDIAATNYGNDTVVILYGYSNGTFVLSRRYSTGLDSSPYGFTAADLNNDKKLELVVACSGNGNILVLTEYYAAVFSKKIVYPTGSSAPQPLSVAVGDFNNDKHVDIVVANSGTDNLGIQLGFGDGTFGTEMIYMVGTGSHPQYVITSDINQDNQLDIISANSRSNTISVIMGYGNGSFAAQLVPAAPNANIPYAIASGDFNNDTRIDFVITNEGADTIGVFYNFDYTFFEINNYYGTSSSATPLGVIVSNFNNDNYSDIATTFYGSNEIGIIIGYANGRFGNMTTYSTGSGSQPWGIDDGDFNNDGLLDIVVANMGTNTIGILLGYGNGSFATMVTYSTGQNSAPIAVAVDDLNHDGQLDIVEANSNANSIGVLFGYGNGAFSGPQTYSTGQNSVSRSVAIGDFNNDHQLDIVVANYLSDSVGILLGYGNGTFQNQTIFSTGYYSRPYCVTVYDFNKDNKLDIATANLNTNEVGILLGNGDGTFANVVTYAAGGGSLPRYISVGDFNNDNISDIAIANSGANYIFLLFGFGDGSFLYGSPVATGDGTQPYGLAIADFNKDARLDIAVAISNGGNIAIYFAKGSLPFAGMVTYTPGIGSQPHSVAVADLNHDGWLDIAVASYGIDSVTIFLGKDGKRFIQIGPFSTGNGTAPYSVAIADFDNDHKLDIVVTNSGADSISILFGYGNGTFRIGATYSTGSRSRPYTVTTGNFNNDNITDIVVANSGTSDIFLLYGSINGTFGNSARYPLGYGYQPYSVVAADLNHDNQTDIVIACLGTDHVETLVKTC